MMLSMMTGVPRMSWPELTADLGTSTRICHL